MKKGPAASALSRRNFLGAVAAGTAAVSATGSLAAADKVANPYEYKVDHLFKTDPKLLLYDLEIRMACPRKDARRVAIGPDDAIYLAAGKFVTIFNADRSQRGELALDDSARAVAVGKDGFIYVALKDHVEVYDAQGQRKAAWPSPAVKTWFAGLAVGENDVFAGDAGNRVVLRYDKSGKLVGRIGEKNAARNIPGIITPSPFLDVEIGKDGLLRVANAGRHQVEVYNFAGDLEFSWGKPTMAVDGFCGCCNPVNLALLPDGRYVTCEKGLPRVKIYSEKGVFEGVVCGPDSFPESLRTGIGLGKGDGSQAGVDAAVDAQGRVYVLDQLAGELRIMKPKAGLKS
jgi:hypothetical protein